MDMPCRKYFTAARNHLFADGTKMEANTNQYSFVWENSTTKHEARLLEKMEVICQAFGQRYGILQQGAD